MLHEWLSPELPGHQALQARISLLKSSETAEDGGEVWHLMMSEAPKRDQESASTEQRRPEPSREAQRPSSAAGKSFDESLDDAIPF